MYEGSQETHKKYVRTCSWIAYRVTRNFCGSLILRIRDFLCFAETYFCEWDKLVFLAGN